MRQCCAFAVATTGNGCSHSCRPTSNNPEPKRSESENPSAIRLTCGFRSAAGSSARLGLFSFSGRREARISGATAPLEHVITQFVSGEAFQILGVRPALGRLFSARGRSHAGGHPFAVLSYDSGADGFGADPAFFGRPFTSAVKLGARATSWWASLETDSSAWSPESFVDIWIPGDDV